MLGPSLPTLGITQSQAMKNRYQVNIFEPGANTYNQYRECRNNIITTEHDYISSFILISEYVDAILDIVNISFCHILLLVRYLASLYFYFVRTMLVGRIRVSK